MAIEAIVWVQENSQWNPDIDMETEKQSKKYTQKIKLNLEKNY